MGLFLVFSPAILYVGCGAESVENGLEAPARVEVSSGERYGVPVDDTDAADSIGGAPAFSDENWIRMGGIPGEYAGLRAAVADSAGNLYVGGYFSAIDEREVHYIAKWDGNEWSTLGSGLNRQAYAFAASGNDVYVGGEFTTAGGKVSVNLAKFQGIVDDPPGAVSTDQE